MEMPLTHNDPRLTMWSLSPSMETSLPSRTAAIMPQPHEQKLHEVVNSFTSESFRSLVAAFKAGRSSKLPSAKPPTLPLNHCRRLTAGGPCTPPSATPWFDWKSSRALFSFGFICVGPLEKIKIYLQLAKSNEQAPERASEVAWQRQI